MKSTIVIAVIAALTTAVVGTPALSTLEAREAEAERAGLLPRACPGARSSCRLDWAKKCEWWCQNRGGFHVMESCYLGFSRCCCNN
ncbi:uncharacterized protein SETTUDRAFT_28371 [Exserohilum turcica Et28A]|uniref:Uncharacterized protein n=1 Tax=Exserohilum turcicum (strain 28A) TaxID=671987 RepID=R0JZN6_EXST2|nr:uncharacterized protein SETTUDRAFT_28371 [Exserohilum turcica Et28A]EOA86358.1 hypothetical protein SETTUDRAFT_28371 [Exserohilum turcica Et28A]